MARSAAIDSQPEDKFIKLSDLPSSFRDRLNSMQGGNFRNSIVRTLGKRKKTRRRGRGAPEFERGESFFVDKDGNVSKLKDAVNLPNIEGRRTLSEKFGKDDNTFQLSTSTRKTGGSIFSNIVDAATGAVSTVGDAATSVIKPVGEGLTSIAKPVFEETAKVGDATIGKIGSAIGSIAKKGLEGVVDVAGQIGEIGIKGLKPITDVFEGISNIGSSPESPAAIPINIAGETPRKPGRRSSKRRRSRSTILTSSRGILGSPTTTGKTLLGS